MVSLVADDYRLLQVMSRFGIPVGFGDKTVEQVCRNHGIDTATFLAVVNFITAGSHCIDSTAEISLEALLKYLKASHRYFLDFFLPSIRRKLLDGIRFRTTDISILILKFFDEYVAEVNSHMEYEEKMVFEYVGKLLKGIVPEEFEITTYSRHHELVSEKLGELKSLLLRYGPESSDVNLLNAALYDIYLCEQELANHCLIEDYIFVPVIRRLESKLSGNEG